MRGLQKAERHHSSRSLSSTSTVELIDGIGQNLHNHVDLTEGYYQVLMEQGSKDKTVFVTPFGKYQFQTMPFGLISAPSTIQRLMDEVLQELHPFVVA